LASKSFSLIIVLFLAMITKQHRWNNIISIWRTMGLFTHKISKN
jgi:hypothetical protein